MLLYESIVLIVFECLTMKKSAAPEEANPISFGNLHPDAKVLRARFCLGELPSMKQYSKQKLASNSLTVASFLKLNIRT